MSVLQHIFKEEPGPAAGNGRLTLFYLLIILLAGIKQVYGVQHYLDITFFDETEYLYRGLLLPDKPYNDWSPAYNIWYYLLSFIQHNPVDLFYLNYIIIQSAVPLLLFIFLVRYKINPSLAFLLSLSYSLHPIVYSCFTLVGHFCLMIILTGFILLSLAKSDESKLIISLTTAYICIFIRVEFLIIFLAIAALWCYFILLKRKFSLHIGYLIFVVIAVGIYVWFDGLSFKWKGMDRSYGAFMQYFYQNYVFWNKQSLTLDEFNNLKLFGNSKTMAECLFYNPGLFIKHVLTNMFSYLINIFKYFEDLLFPPPVFHYLGKIKHVLFFVTFVFLSFKTYKRFSLAGAVSLFRDNRIISLIAAIFFLWSFFSLFIVYPNKHYIIIQFGWWILIIANILEPYTKWLNNRWILFSVSVIFLWLAPTAKSINYYHDGQKDIRTQPNLKTIQYLTKNNNGQSQVLFTSESGFYAYLPTNYKEYFLEQEDVKPYITNGKIDILRFFNDKQIDVIYMNEKMQHLFEITLGEDGQTLLNEPEKMGFKKQIINPNLQAYLLYRIHE